MYIVIVGAGKVGYFLAKRLVAANHIVSIIDKDIKWKINAVNSTLFSVFLFAIAFFIERFALSAGRWSYSAFMPTIFGIGISPLFQLLVTGWISLFITRKI